MVHLFDRISDDKNMIMRERRNRYEVEVRADNRYVAKFPKGNKEQDAFHKATLKYYELYSLMAAIYR